MIDLTSSPDKLRASILQDAMQGKLTKQLPEDGNAEELLKKIQNEKQKLIDEKKIKKQKPLPEIQNDEIPFDIPDSWKWVRFSSLYELIGGSQPPKSHFISNIKHGYIRLYQTRDYGSHPNPIYIPTKEAKKISNENDLLVARYGGSLGKIFWAHKGAYNVALAKVTPITNKSLKLNKYYIWYYLKSNLYQSFIKSLSKSAQSGFNKNDLIRLIIPIPPLSEQKRIVEKLNYLLPKVEEFNDSVKNLDSLRIKFPDRLKNSFLQSAMMGKLTKQLPEDGNADELLKQIEDKKQQLIKEKKIKKQKPLPEIQDDEIPFDIPDNWKWVRLGYLTYYDIGGKTPNKSNPRYWSKEGTPWLSVKDVNNDYINDSIDHITNLAVKETAKIVPNNSFIAVTRMAVGKFCINTKTVAINQDLRALIMNTDIINYIKLIYPIFKFKTKGATVKGITKEELNNKLVPLPPLSEQKRIIEKLDKLFSYLKE